MRKPSLKKGSVRLGNQGLSHRIGLGFVALFIILYGLLSYIEQEKKSPHLSILKQDSLMLSIDSHHFKSNDSTSFKGGSTGNSSFGFWKKPPSKGEKLYGIKYTKSPAFEAKQPLWLETADSAALEQLPGIGPVLAARIIRYRNKLGGFYELNQLREVYGLPDSLFDKIIHRLRLGKNQVELIKLNQATEMELSRHPYIQWKMARQLIRYRTQNGSFNDAEDLKKIWGIDTVKIQKLLPYLQFARDST